MDTNNTKLTWKVFNIFSTFLFSESADIAILQKPRYHILKCLMKLKPKLSFFIKFNSQGHIGIGPQSCHLLGLNPGRGDSLGLDAKFANY